LFAKDRLLAKAGFPSPGLPTSPIEKRIYQIRHFMAAG
jgi:hypothetical protein